MTGVVEHGLFNGMVNKVIVAGKDGVKIVEVKDQSCLIFLLNCK